MPKARIRHISGLEKWMNVLDSGLKKSGQTLLYYVLMGAILAAVTGAREPNTRAQIREKWRTTMAAFTGHS